MTIITTSILNGTTDLYVLSAGDTYLVIPGVTLVTEDPVTAVSVFKTLPGATATDISILGTLASDGPCVFISHGDSHMVSVGADGVVATMGAGGSYPIYMFANASRLDNAGQIIGNLNSAGVYVTGNGSDVVNSGKITGGVGGVILSGDSISLTNTGLITGSRGDNATGFSAVDFVNTGSGAIFNAGTILGEGNGFSAAVSLGGSGPATLDNTGLMSSTRGSGVVSSADTQITLTNTGTIRGGITALDLGNLDDTVVNRGTLIGRVELGLGADIFDTRGGTVLGAVHGQDGDDTYRVDGMDVVLVELANQGADRVESTADYDLTALTEVEHLTLLGGAVRGTGNALGNAITGNLQDNRIAAGDGADTVTGGGGEDRLFEDGGFDLVNGGEGNDTLRGGVSGDTLYGGTGDDVLHGDAGSDRLYGEDGEDLLVGGSGRDTLYGGVDADTFRFRAVTDSAAGSTLRDQIVGFEAGLDLVDLALIDANTVVTGNQTFVFLGNGAFTSVAGQLRVITGASSVLQADVNGDGVADFELQLNGIATVNVNDILL